MIPIALLQRSAITSAAINAQKTPQLNCCHGHICLPSRLCAILPLAIPRGYTAVKMMRALLCTYVERFSVHGRWLVIGVILLSCLTVATQEGKVPHFAFYKMKSGEGIVSLVVPRDTTDRQLELLLRLIRDKVQQGRFAEIGITHPTDKRFGMLGYGAGMISIYRGDRCANETFIDDLGPCGYGEHDSASYQWGIDGNPKKDSGAIRAKNGDLRTVF
jgi:hypothetical protein